MESTQGNRPKNTQEKRNLFATSFSSTRDRFVLLCKFLFSQSFRWNKGLPWVQLVLRDNWMFVRSQLDASEEMLGILRRYSRGEKISKDERARALRQLITITKLVPALAVFLLPGGMLLLPLVAKALPWDLLPARSQGEKKPEP